MEKNCHLQLHMMNLIRSKNHQSVKLSCYQFFLARDDTNMKYIEQIVFVVVIFCYYEKNGQRSIVKFVRCRIHLFRCHLFFNFKFFPSVYLRYK